MNRNLLQEDIQKILLRWNQLRQQFGEQAVNVPEFTHLSKIIKFIQQQTQQRRAQAEQIQRRKQMQKVASDNQVNNTFSGQVSTPNANMTNNMMTETFQEAGNFPTQEQHKPQQIQQGFNNITPQQNGMSSMYSMPYRNGIPNQANMTYAPGQNTSDRLGSVFSTQQVQLLNSQFQVFRHLLKDARPGGTPIPQHIIDYVTNEKLTFANGNFLQEGSVSYGSTSSQTQSSNVKPQGTPGTLQSPMNPVAMPRAQQDEQNSFRLENNQEHGRANATRVSSRSKRSPSIASPQLNRPNQLFHAQQYQLKTSPEQTLITPIQEQANGSINLSRKRSTKEPSTGGQKGTPIREMSLNPLCLPPKPPVSLDSLTQTNGEADLKVLPINRPNIQVDCFEVSNMELDKYQDISYSEFYSPHCRFQIPSLFPEGLDYDKVLANREAFITLKLQHEKETLAGQLELDEQDDDKRDELNIRLTSLELNDFQKHLREKLLSQVWFSKCLLPNSHPNFLAKFNELSFNNVTLSEDLYRQQLFSLVQAQNKKRQTMINAILSHRNNEEEKFLNKGEKLEKLSSRISSFHGQVAKEEQKKMERVAKQRLQALKLNDEEAYMKLLDNTKDTRITHLLKETNHFLDCLAQAVQSQQKESLKTGPDAFAGMDNMNDDERREKVDYYHVAHRIKEEVTTQPSILVGGQLKEYQMKGLQWMVSLFNNHLNGILADEMGLGKTIQTISLIAYLVEFKKIPGPFLVVVPLSTLTNWSLEFDKWAPSVKKVAYKGTPLQRKQILQVVKQGDFQILLTTFEYIIKDRNLLSKVKWVHMIIDEGHRLKNNNSKLSEMLTHNYHSDYRLILTGTPLQNNLPELWALLNFVLPKIFNSVKSFDDWFNTPFANKGSQDKMELSEEETLLIIRRLHKVLRPFLLRRLKQDVEKDLPNKVEKVVKCKMSALQSKLYQQMLKYNTMFVASPDDPEKPIVIKNANNQIMQLRKICNHPFAYEEVETFINPTAETNAQIWRVAGKFELLDRILPKLKSTGHRVLIFFQMTLIMDIMEDFLRFRGMKYMRLDGTTKSDDRTGLLKLFNDKDSEYFCFLLSTRAGGLGLNLQAADTVIIFDTDWNPHQDLQAQDRAHRIGQKSEVRILRLITENSVEEMILERAYAKLEIDGKVIQAGKFDNKSTAEEQEALLRALLEKEEERKSKGASDENDELDDDELNELIARNEKETEVFKGFDEDRIQETKNASYTTRLLNEQELPYIYKEDPETLLKKEEVVAEYGRGNRERKTPIFDDNLTEEQWLRNIDGMMTDSEEEDVGPKKKRKKNVNKLKKAAKVSDNEDDVLDDEAELDSNAPHKRKANEGEVLDDRLGLKKSRGKTTPLQGENKSGPRFRKSSSRSSPAIDTLSSEERSSLQEKLLDFYNTILKFKDEDGRQLSELFLVKPPKKYYPDYYILIKRPIALDAIKKKINEKRYSTSREVLEDLHLMFSNARIYNEEGSLVYEDALSLENLAFDKFKEINSHRSQEEINQYLDFSEMDEVFQLKPPRAKEGEQDRQ